MSKCDKCGREKISAGTGVTGFPGYYVSGSRVEYCGFCDAPPEMELVVPNGGPIELIRDADDNI